jgi:hypothetical protein
MGQDTEPTAAELSKRDYRRSVAILAAFVVTALALKGLLTPLYPIHDDEFYYLSQVYAHERGEPQPPFQTFHVHFFRWLSAVGPNEVTQVVAARMVMYLLLLGTCFYLFRLARYFLGTRGAVFCVLCYLCFLSTIANGASFRSDTPAAFFMVFALYHFIVREDSAFAQVRAGLALAVSLLFTIKAAIYLPVFAAWFLARLLLRGGGWKSLMRTGGFLGALVLGFLALYKLHTATLPHSGGGNNAAFLGGVFSTFVTFGQIFPARRWIIQTLVIDSFIWLLLLGGLMVHGMDLRQRRYARHEPQTLLPVLAIPLLSLLFYRNAYPYFFVFLMPTATVFCGYAFEFPASKLKNAGRMTAAVLSAVLGLMVFANFLVHVPRYLLSQTELTVRQRDVLAAVHQMFPQPVPYVDTCSMVASYPKVGLFMSPAGIHSYHRYGQPVMGRLLSQRKPAFLLVNYPWLLDLNRNEPPRPFGGEGLFDEDWAALRSYFIHHWGPIWVAGKQFDPGSAAEPRCFEIIAPGLYTVEAPTDVLIDGTLYRDGSVVRLQEGAHTVRAEGASTMIRLRWGDHLYRPNSEQEGTSLGAPHY